MSKKLIVLSGLPGSGKTTWAENYESKDPDNVYIVSSDKIRKEITNSYSDFSKEKSVWAVFDDAVVAYSIGHPNCTVILDATHLSTRQKEVVFNKNRHRFGSIDLVIFDVDLDTLLERNKKREGTGKHIPESSIIEYYSQYEYPKGQEYDFLVSLFDNVITLPKPKSRKIFS